MTGTTVKRDDNYFKSFLQLNQTKIDMITPKNPMISKDDEWINETEWDDLFKELSTKER